ncbi:hypothetical protein C474_07527 [Halogeometricum pallidum JCM 14848]|uniref:Uncharacterized protein n=1 Tax=Halogeometricum pallidum JCM 14848 TaxID=1227487 RepID=M0DAY5_HALPD|nr:hypothetical protein C474_07527 [Halogeometricum pallidum JCM 14848]
MTLTVDFIPRLVGVVSIESNVQNPDLRFDIRCTFCDCFLTFQSDHAVLSRFVRSSDLERDLLGPCSHVTLPEQLSVRLDEVDLVDIGFCRELNDECRPFDGDSLERLLTV